VFSRPRSRALAPPMARGWCEVDEPSLEDGESAPGPNLAIRGGHGVRAEGRVRPGAEHELDAESGSNPSLTPKNPHPIGTWSPFAPRPRGLRALAAAGSRRRRCSRCRRSLPLPPFAAAAAVRCRCRRSLPLPPFAAAAAVRCRCRRSLPLPRLAAAAAARSRYKHPQPRLGAGAATRSRSRHPQSPLAAAAASTHLCRIELCLIERGVRSLETAELVTRAVPARRDRGREAPRPLLEAAVQSACASRGWREVDEPLIEARKERSGAESESGPERASDPHVVASRPAAACYRHSPPLAAESSSAESSSA